MRNGLKHLFGIAALMVTVSGLAGRAEAAAIVSVTPTPVIVEVGDTFSIDVMIDADDPLGGFDLDVAFDSGILTWQVLALTGFAQFGPGSFWDLQTPAADLLRASIAGDPIGANLATSPFSAVRVDFLAAALGVSAINVPYADLSNELGTALLDRQVQGGVVCVVADKQTFNPADCVVPVPEPGLMALLATGLATAVVRRRRKA